MNWLDYLFIAIFLASFIGGLMKGLARGVVGLVAAVVGIVLACRFYAEPGWRIRHYVGDSRATANGIAFVLILLAVIIAGGLLGWLLSRLFKWAGVGWLDRLLGGAFGLVRAALISIAIVMIGMAFPRTTVPEAIIHSRFAPYFVGAAGWLVAITPSELKSDFWHNYEDVKKVWDDVMGPGKKKFPETEL